MKHNTRLDADLVAFFGVGEDVEDLLLDGEGLDEDLGLVTLLLVGEGDLAGVSALWLETFKRLLSERIHNAMLGRLFTFLIRVKLAIDQL